MLQRLFPAVHGESTRVSMKRAVSSKICSILLSALLLVASLHTPAQASPEEDLQTLGMFYEGKDLVFSATRNPKLISQSAENITVVTAAEIEMMGAHTLADVLNNIPGIVKDDRGSVGTFAGASIQGASPFHLLVLQDGITLNQAGDGSADIAAIPLQQIERIEIVKGPGSSSWGSALGGVINIVTKTPNVERKFGGAIAATIGEKLTREARGEASGTVGRLGYYLYGGNLATDGLQPVTGIDANNIYGKLRWELPGQGNLLFTLGYTRERSDDGVAPLDIILKDTRRAFLSTLSLNYPLTSTVDLDLSLRLKTRSVDGIMTTLSSGEFIQFQNGKELTYGGSAKVTWRQQLHSLAVGADFDHIKADASSSSTDYTVVDEQHFKSDKWGVFLNDTITIGKVAITPGLRYDRMNPVGDFISPSLGIAWNLNDQTTLRAYTARGFSLPLVIPGSTQEEVRTIQAGIETTQIPYLWLKGTLFRNYLKDSSVYDDAAGMYITAKQQKQGLEIEAKSVPFLKTSLAVGYTFIDTTNRATGEVLRDIPRQIAKLGLHYDDKRSLRGALLGHYVWWNASAGSNARYNAIIWDLNLAKRLFTRNNLAVELFFSAHNLFNGAQYNWGVIKNARRWLEGGIRFDF